MKYIIDKENSGILIKSFLKQNGYSSALLTRLKKQEDGILVNGVHQNVLYVLQEGDVLALKQEDTGEDVNENLIAVDLPIDIIFEDENITVINKPGNMPTHPSINNYKNSLANALAFRYREKPYVFRAINRLDKDTSGIVITANNKYYSALISNKLIKGQVEKEYIAIVSGKLEGEGTIDAPIGRIGQSIIKREVRADGDSAITSYKVLASCDEASVLAVYPKTGRTHQIRVHLAHIGYPIIGDGLYFEESEHISRQALHCIRMKINEIGEFYAKLPKDMEELIRRYFGDTQIV
ncbi:MAG: RluA family pseudouridine synthase [Clostridia bacterium]|nr:RluA family pseudouridine synthase [Clostridia bacterium]